MKNMKEPEAVNQFLAGRRVAIAKFVAHRYKEVQNKAKKVVGVVNLYEVQCADGKAHSPNVVPSQRPDSRTGRRPMPMHVQRGAKDGGRVRSDGTEHV
jgi:hypothetical protein